MIQIADWPVEIHESLEQQQRLERARSPKTKPISIDKNMEEGVFQGSGHSSYKTTLNQCTCIDFVRRKLPCKHIYRLAIEIGLLALKVEAQFSLDTAIAELENQSDFCQILIKNFLKQSLYYGGSEFKVILDAKNEGLDHCFLLEHVDAPSTDLDLLNRKQIIQALDENYIDGFRRSMKLDALKAWCIENIANLNIFPTVNIYRFAEPFQALRRRTYTYLLRKFDWDVVYNEDEDGMYEVRYPHGAKFEDVSITIKQGGETVACGNPNVCHFPDDEVTALLTLYGHNRCLNGFDISSQPRRYL